MGESCEDFMGGRSTGCVGGRLSGWVSGRMDGCVRGMGRLGGYMCARAGLVLCSRAPSPRPLTLSLLRLFLTRRLPLLMASLMPVSLAAAMMRISISCSGVNAKMPVIEMAM